MFLHTFLVHLLCTPAGSLSSLSGVNTEQILTKAVLASLSLVCVCVRSKGISTWLTLLSVFLPA